MMTLLPVLSQAYNMEEERERLNRRISQLTEKLTDAKCGNSIEALNVRYFPFSLNTSQEKGQKEPLQ